MPQKQKQQKPKQKQQQPKRKQRSRRKVRITKTRVSTIHPRILTTSKNEFSPWKRQTLAIRSLITSIEDRYHSSLLSSVFDPSKPYPLPSPGTYAFSAYNGQMLGATIQALGNLTANVPATVNNWYNTESRGTTLPQYSSAGSMVGRYTRFSGKAITTISTQTDATGNLEVWFCHDPFNLEYPVIVFVPSTTGDYTGMTRLASVPWTSDPFPLTKSYQDESGSNPGLKIEERNLYFEGGSMLDVHTLNTNAFLQVSYQTRTGMNVTDRFVDTLPTLWTTSDPGQSLSMTDYPKRATGAISLYNGTVWSMGVSFAIAADENDAKFGYSEYFRRCWASGANWIRAKVQTTNNGAPTAGAVSFSVTFLSWNATAPSSPSLAGSMPNETVPVESPTWMRTLRTRGNIYKDDADMTEIWRSQLDRIPTAVVPSTPLTRQLITAPAQTMQAIRAAPIAEPESHSTWSTTTSAPRRGGLDMFLERMGGVGNAIGGVLNAGRAIGNFIGSGVARAAPEIEEIVEGGLPLLGAAARYAPLAIMAA